LRGGGKKQGLGKKERPQKPETLISERICAREGRRKGGSKTVRRWTESERKGQRGE